MPEKRLRRVGTKRFHDLSFPQVSELVRVPRLDAGEFRGPANRLAVSARGVAFAATVRVVGGAEDGTVGRSAAAEPGQDRDGRRREVDQAGDARFTGINNTHPLAGRNGVLNARGSELAFADQLAGRQVKQFGGPGSGGKLDLHEGGQRGGQFADRFPDGGGSNYFVLKSVK